MNVALNKSLYINILLNNDTKSFRYDELRYLFIIAYSKSGVAMCDLLEIFSDVFKSMLKSQFLLPCGSGFEINEATQSEFDNKVKTVKILVTYDECLFTLN